MSYCAGNDSSLPVTDGFPEGVARCDGVMPHAVSNSTATTQTLFHKSVAPLT